MEARAIHKYIPTSPRKMRLVVDLIRGKGVEEALSILHFSSKHASKEAEKTLRSAVSNLQNKEDSGRIDFSSLYVKDAFVNEGPTVKRMLPAPMGRAYRIRKRSNHLTIVVAMKKETVKPRIEKQAPKPASKKKAAPKKKGSAPKATPAVKKKTTSTKPKTKKTTKDTE
jgi:large subunit ribosomal protein L22